MSDTEWDTKAEINNTRNYCSICFLLKFSVSDDTRELSFLIIILQFDKEIVNKVIMMTLDISAQVNAGFCLFLKMDRPSERSLYEGKGHMSLQQWKVLVKLYKHKKNLLIEKFFRNSSFTGWDNNTKE